MRKPRKSWSVAAVGGLVSACLIGTVTPSSQAAEGEPQTVQEFTALSRDEQLAILRPLRDFADAVDKTAREHAADVYSGVRLDPLARRVDVYLTQRDRSDEILAAAKKNHPGIDISVARVNASKYTRLDLAEARKRLTMGLRENPGLPYRIVSIAVPSDGHGLKVGVTDPSAVPSGEGSVAARGASDIPDPAALAGVDTTISKQAPMHPSNRRMNDLDPYTGGARIVNPAAQAECSAGFPVRFSDGNPGMVTANHCVTPGNNADQINRPDGGKLGVISDREPYYDAAVYRTNAPVAPYLYYGAWNSDQKGLIISTGGTQDGDYVCNGGSVIGQKCGIRVDDADSYLVDDWGNVWAAGVSASQANNAAAGISGDSGGPVYEYLGTDSGGMPLVQVRGIVNAIANNGPGTPDVHLFFARAYDILNRFEADTVQGQPS
ncbi:S1 family peptidase [Yinghuangia soli]|uniref:S1 family peptidase n=1 Tax=Yinghuangia soli TaxID=2908204 RepID=A0AA41TZX2_9ACTN|nr:S1 family peptidase [Yinghuangia soli]MCF2525812.1 S1 family peptidase [Yinghuangia soli]